MHWIASTLHTTSEHDVSSITTADAHTSAAQQSTELTPRPLADLNGLVPLRPKDEIWFLRMCHHISYEFHYKPNDDARVLACSMYK
jgi:hypothetical protein